MGGAMLRAWLDRGYDADIIHVLEPHPSPEIFELARDRGFALGAPSTAPDILVLAIKPQSLDEAAAGLAAFASPATPAYVVPRGQGRRCRGANCAKRRPSSGQCPILPRRWDAALPC